MMRLATARHVSPTPGPRVLVALADATARVHVSAALVVAGLRILIARSAAQVSALMPAAEVVVADARLLGGLRLPARNLLGAVPLLLLAGRAERLPDARARLGATAVFRAPYD